MSLISVLLLVFVPALAQTEFPPNNLYDANVWQAKVRADKLGAPNYDRMVPPTSNRSLTTNEAGHYSDSGSDIQVGIRFFKVEQVNAAAASMRLKVWVRMSWVDERLAWNPADYGGITKAWYRADQSLADEATEIWLPDHQPYNALNSFVQTLEPSFARASSDGTVFWSRPGGLEVLCKFSGLVAFPFDNLICKMELGGWAWSGGQQGLQLMGQGYEFSAQEETSGASYQEVEIVQVNVSLKTYTYPCCPSEPWPVILYTIKMKRVWFAYFPLVLFPGVLITLLSFAVFFTDTASADALGYGIGVIVVNLLSNFILLGMLPVAGEMLWVDLYSNVNTAFCCMSLFQSSFNIMLENHESDHLLPLWMHIPLMNFASWVRKRTQRKQVMPNEDSGPSLSGEAVIDESVAGVIYRQKYGHKERTVAKSTIGKVDANPAAETELSRAEKLIFYETVFYKLDEDCSLFISEAECDLLLSYTALDLDPETRKSVFRKHDFIADGKLNRVEFVGMCAAVLWDVPTNLIWQAMENMDIARKSRAKRNKVYWNGVANSLDGWARYVLPGLYIFVLIIVYNLDLTDNYADASLTQTEQAFYGFGPASINAQGTAMIIIYTVGVIVVTFASYKLNRISTMKEAKLQEVLKAASRDSVEDMTKLTQISARQAALPSQSRVEAVNEFETAAVNEAK